MDGRLPNIPLRLVSRSRLTRRGIAWERSAPGLGAPLLGKREDDGGQVLLVRA